MRHVTLTLRHLDGSSWAGADLLYQLIPGGSFSASTQYPARQIQDTTNASGQARTPLWENAAAIAPCLIRLWLPNDAFLDFTLPIGGGDVSLMSLLSPPGGGTQGVRSVEGRIGQLTDAGWAGALLTFELESLSYTAEAIYPPDSIQAIADGAGLISQAVWANGGGAVRSRLKITDPEGDFYYCQIPAGSGAVTLSSLRAAAQEPRSPISPTPLPPQTTVPLAALEGLIAAHNADVVAHPGGIAGSGGGSGAGFNTYRHTQASMSTAWSINHSLGRKPSITTYANDGGVIHGQIIYHSDTAATAVFAIAVAGFAYCV